MKTYHYTTPQNWARIKHEGLIPQPMRPHIIESIRRILGTHVEVPPGICTYPKKQKGFAHFGCIMERATHHGSWVILLLEIDHAPEDMYAPVPGSRFTVYHNGTVGHDDMKYHDNVPMRILTRRIPPEQIRLVGEWDIRDARIRRKDATKGLLAKFVGVAAGESSRRQRRWHIRA